MAGRRKVKRLRFGGRVFATILGVLLLFGAVGAGRLVILKQLDIKAFGDECDLWSGWEHTEARRQYASCRGAQNGPILPVPPYTYPTLNYSAMNHCNYIGRSWCQHVDPTNPYEYTCCEVGYSCQSGYCLPVSSGGCPSGYTGTTNEDCRQVCYAGYNDCGSNPWEGCFVNMTPIEGSCSNGRIMCRWTECYPLCTPTNGACNETVAYGCDPGTSIANNYNPATGTYTWSCDGSCGGVNSGPCSMTTNTLTLPSVTINKGQTSAALTATYTGIVPGRVVFDRVPPGNIFTIVPPASDYQYPFTVRVRGVTPGTQRIRARSYATTTGGTPMATTYANVTVRTPSATVTFSPSPFAVNVGSTATLRATVTPVNGTVKTANGVTFSRNNAKITLGTPVKVSANVYTVQVTGRAVGTSRVTATVYFNGITTPITSAASTVIVSALPWWQVVDSDIQTKGDLRSSIPTGSKFNIPRPVGAWAGYPGVVAYPIPPPTYTATFTPGTVSSTGWLANSSATNSKVFNYAYFNGQIPADVTPTTVTSANIANALTTSTTVFNKYGYYWLKFPTTGTLTIPAVNIGTRRVILLAPNANINFTGDVTLNDGVGFFMVIAGKTGAANTYGNITATAKVASDTNLEGIYVADGTFYVGTSATWRLIVRGSVVGNGGGNLAGRTYKAGAANPAIRFEYAPDQIMLFPGKLGARKIDWNEVAP